jgi:YegS/Rv2252/BmrU family lipid kinase
MNGADSARHIAKAELEERIKSERSCVLLVNTHSRRGRELFTAAREQLVRQGYRILEEFAVANPSRLGAVVERAMAFDPSLLVVGSGDGTASTVTGHLAYRNTALGLLPLGTTNNFARNLGIPFNLEEAVRVITTGKVVDVDLGRVGDHYFANAASIGLAVDVARSISPRLKRVVGRPAYAITGVRTFVSHSPFRATVQTPEARHEFLTHMLILANGGYLGGREIAKGASLEDRELTIFPLGDHRTVRLAADLINHAYGRRRYVTEGPFISAARATVVTEPERCVEIDGEIKATTPIEVSVARQALRMMAPQSFVDL